MFRYNINFFLGTTSFREEFLTSNTRMKSHEYQDILIQAYEFAKDTTDFSEKRLRVLQYLNCNYGFVEVNSEPL